MTEGPADDDDASSSSSSSSWPRTDRLSGCDLVDADPAPPLDGAPLALFFLKRGADAEDEEGVTAEDEGMVEDKE